MQPRESPGTGVQLPAAFAKAAAPVRQPRVVPPRVQPKRQPRVVTPRFRPGSTASFHLPQGGKRTSAVGVPSHAVRRDSGRPDERRTGVLGVRRTISKLTQQQRDAKRRLSPLARKLSGQQDICWHFQRGRCLFGERCRFRHELPEGHHDMPGAAAATEPLLASGTPAASAASKSEGERSLWQSVVAAWRGDMSCPRLPLPQQVAGDRGEEVTSALARDLIGKRGQRFIFQNVRVPEASRRGRKELDLVVLSPTGVLCIEVKAWAGHLKFDQDQWTQGWRAAQPSPVQLVKAKAEVLREYLLRTLEPELAHTFSVPEAVRGIVMLAKEADLELPAGDEGKEIRADVVTSGDAPAFLSKLWAQRGGFEILVDALLPQGWRVPGLRLRWAELEAARRVVGVLGTWDSVHLHGGRVLRGDLRLQGPLGDWLHQAGGRRAIGEVRLKHLRGPGFLNHRRVRRVLRVLRKRELHCKAHAVLRTRRRHCCPCRSQGMSAEERAQATASAAGASLCEEACLWIREAGQAQDSSYTLADVDAVTLSAV
eukprot:TRINITY_DN36824_c0_g1_i1.p1 TRINITY_DN36824_c0_g1~~TRINITY_DN36824_c0_g1_i1.p1  ORF type:complete len:550 (-),score=94.37 TRINITY_DN36824_c0_g1_i1:164-1783(-)